MSFGFGFALPAYPLRGGGGNNPFNQDGPTLDLSFTGNAGNLSGANTYTLNTNFITPEYQVAAQYAIWESGVGLAQKTFSQIITFTRASTATYFDSAGTLTTAAIDAPRFDYDPATLLARGFLIEEARTNSIRNNTMVGAVAGTPGTLPSSGWSVFTSLTGLTRTVVGTGTENGITYIDIQLSGTPSTAGNYFINFENSTQVVATNGQTWTTSLYCKLSAGTLNGISSIRVSTSNRDSGGNSIGVGETTFTPTAASLSSQRISATFTNASVSTAFELPYLVLILTGVAIDITLRIGLPQLELGAFATSVIPTTTTALTRSADVASVNTLSPWFNATEGTLYAEAVITGSVSALSTAWRLDDTTDNERMFVRSNSNLIQFSGIDGGVTQWNLNSGNNITLATTFKHAGAYKINDIASAFNGGNLLTDTSATLPTVTKLLLGGANGGDFLNGYLRRITYYPRRLSNAELQTITA